MAPRDGSPPRESPAAFSFALRVHVRCGPGTVREVPAWLGEHGYRRPAAIVDAAVASQPLCAEVLDAFARAFPPFQTYPNAVSEPDYAYLDTVAAHFRGTETDSLIAIGGGSTIDLAKGVSVLRTNPGRALEYRGFNLVKTPGPPIVAVPTTAGTGSEVTPNAVFTDREAGRKLGINTDLYLPKLAVLDPLLVVTCPRSVTVSSGMDALVHAVEGFAARSATPMSRMYSREGFRLMFNALPAAVSDPDDAAIRAQTLLGAHYAAIGLMNAGAGPAGALSYPLGVAFAVPHGIAGGVFLAPVARLNVQRGATIYADLYDLIEANDAARSREEKSRRLCDRLEALCRTVGVPATLTGFGVSSTHVSMLAEQTMLLRGAVEQNPVPMTQADLTAILTGMV